MATTFKTLCTRYETPGGAGPGTTTLYFGPDYHNERNKEWSIATPALSIVFTAKNEAAAQFQLGRAYTFTAEESPEQP